MRTTTPVLASASGLLIALGAFASGRWSVEISNSSIPTTPEATIQGHSQGQDTVIKLTDSLCDRIIQGESIPVAVWRRARITSQGDIVPAHWGLGIRGADEHDSALHDPDNPFNAYEFTTVEQAIDDGYYVPFEIWVPERTLDIVMTDPDGQPLDVALVVPGHWSWAIRRYDELAYNYPEPDKLYDPWVDQ